jgi:hypothetical protein
MTTPTKPLVVVKSSAETLVLPFTTLPKDRLDMIGLDLAESDSLKDCCDALSLSDSFATLRNAEDAADPLKENFASEADMQNVLNALHDGISSHDCSSGTNDKPCFSVLRLEDDEVVVYPVAKPDQLLKFGVEEIKTQEHTVAKVGDQIVMRLFRMSQMKQHYRLLVGFARIPKKLYVFVMTRDFDPKDRCWSLRTKAFSIDPKLMIPIIRILDGKPVSHFLVPDGETLVKGLASYNISHEFTRVRFLTYYSSPVYLVSLPVPKHPLRLDKQVAKLQLVAKSSSSSSSSRQRRSNRVASRTAAAMQLNAVEEDMELQKLYSNTTFMIKMHAPQLALKLFGNEEQEQYEAERNALAELQRPYFVGSWSSATGAGKLTDVGERLLAFAQGVGKFVWDRDSDDEKKSSFQGVVILHLADLDSNDSPMTLDLLLRPDSTEQIKLDTFQALSDVRADLAQIHAGGFVHTDVRPRNIMRFEGTWRLVDFATSRRIEGAGSLVQLRKASLGARRRHLGKRLLQAMKDSSEEIVEVLWTPEDDFEMLEAAVLFR